MLYSEKGPVVVAGQKKRKFPYLSSTEKFSAPYLVINSALQNILIHSYGSLNFWKLPFHVTSSKSWQEFRPHCKLQDPAKSTSRQRIPAPPLTAQDGGSNHGSKVVHQPGATTCASSYRRPNHRTRESHRSAFRMSKNTPPCYKNVPETDTNACIGRIFDLRPCCSTRSGYKSYRCFVGCKIRGFTRS